MNVRINNVNRHGAVSGAIIELAACANDFVKEGGLEKLEKAADDLTSGLFPPATETALSALPPKLRLSVERSLVEQASPDVAARLFDDFMTVDNDVPLIPFDDLRDSWRGSITVGKSPFGSAAECDCGEVDLATLWNGAFAHKEDKRKEGMWFMPVAVEPVVRTNENVKAFFGACIDSDDGTIDADVIDRAAAQGLACMIATTHSHLKAKTDIPLKKTQALMEQGLSPAEILIQERKYRPEVAADARLGDVIEKEERHGGKKVKVAYQVIHHRPCHRLRIFIPYAAPLLRSDFASHAEFEAMHKRVYHAVAAMIGVENYDRSCTNPARIFYTARHPKGAEFWSIELPGKLLDIHSTEFRATLPPEEPRREKAKAKTQRTEESSPIFSGDLDLKRWAAVGFGKSFMIVDALEARYPDAFFGNESDGWHSVRCPTDAHEQNGGTHVKNPDSENGFAIDCKHNTCKGEPIKNDRLNLLAAMLEAKWLTPADLVAREFFDGSDAEHADAVRRLTPQKLPAGYVQRPEGICFVRDAGENVVFDFVCAPFSVAGESRNESGNDWAMILEFASDGAIRREAIPMADLHGDSREIRRRLAGAGLRIDAAPNSKSRFDSLLSRLETDRKLLTATHAGFHQWQGKSVFVCPTGQAFDAEGERPDVSLISTQVIEDARPAGTHGAWYEALEKVAATGNHHWTIGVCSGFAGPLVDLLRLPTTGIFLTGESSKGKSAAQGWGASVWGNPADKRGLMHSMRATDNAVENLAARAHGSCLQLDEVGAMPDPRQLGKIVFALAGNAGKSRQSAHGSLRTSTRWRTFATFSSEKTLEQVMESVSQKMVTGQSVRFPSVNVAGMRYVSREELKAVEAFKANYGHAGPDFIRYLFKQGYVAEPTKLQAKVDERVEELARSRPDSSTTARAAIPFALLWVAGDIAKNAGLLPMSLGVESAVRWAWDSYLNGSEADALSPMDRALSAMRTRIQAGWGSEITSLSALNLVDDACRPVRWGWFDDDTIYILKDRLAELAGNADSAQGIVRHLHEIGILHRAEKDKLRFRHVPGRGKIDHYRLDRAKFLGEDAQEGE